MKFTITICLFVLFCQCSFAQSTVTTEIPPQRNPKVFDIVNNVNADRIEQDIKKLVSFGTRHTMSDTVSTTSGIGAARRWIFDEFTRISEQCYGCMEVKYHSGIVEVGESRRIPERTKIVNVMAIKRGTVYPNRYVIMSGDIDSRVSDALDSTSENPGANDNASGMAGVLEAARVLSGYNFPTSIIFVGLSGEEQGLFGGKFLAETATKEGWNIVGVLNNDMIGNIHGIDGVIDNTTFRVFSEAMSPKPSEQELIWNRFYGGEVDGPSRQLARYVHKMTENYMTNLRAIMIYRLDRFGRGGHHKPFNDAGFPGVRIMETHENYNRQHQDIRSENGIEYGDVIDGVDFDYAAKLTTVNAITLASLAWAPPAPEEVMIGGAVKHSTRLKWKESTGSDVFAYKIYWRETTSSTWDNYRYVGKMNDFTLENIVIDNYFFGVSAVNRNGDESPVVYPKTLIPRGLRK